MHTVLSTKDLVLRTVSEVDIDEIARMWKHPEKISLDEAHKVLATMEQRHSKNRVKAIYHLCLGVFCKDEPNTLIGWCGLDGRCSPNEIVLFYIIAEEFRCKGYATQCAVELLRFAFEDMQYDMVSGGCAKDNRASFGVMKKAGMCHNVIYDDGGLGFYMDKEIYMKLKSEGR